MKRLYTVITSIPKRIVMLMIRLYQRTISPDHGWFHRFFNGGFCRFWPSCSEYGYRVVDELGIIRGVPLALWRILRCNPWNKGGIDLPPKRK